MRSLPPVEFCRGTSPIQAASSRPGLEEGGIGSGRRQGAGRDRPDAGNGLETPARLVRAVPGEDALLGRIDLVVEGQVLPRQPFQAGAGKRRQPVIKRRLLETEHDRFKLAGKPSQVVRHVLGIKRPQDIAEENVAVMTVRQSQHVAPRCECPV